MYDVQAAIDFCVSKFEISTREVDFRHSTGIGPDEKVRRFLDILGSKIQKNPGFFKTFLDWLKSCPSHAQFGIKIGAIIKLIIMINMQ